jgi:hypothetical protein
VVIGNFSDNRVINRVDNRATSRLSQITLPPLGGYSDNPVDNPVIIKNNWYVKNNGCDITCFSLVSSVNIHLLVKLFIF